MQRLITAIGLLAFAFYLVFFCPEPGFVAAAVIVGLLCYREFASLVAGHGVPSPGWLGAAAGAFLVLAPVLHVDSVVLLLAGETLAVILFFIAALRLAEIRQILPYTACTLLGAVYAFAPWRFAVDLRQRSVHLLFFALALNWAGDSLAYYVGRRFGRHRLAPILSPKKSWEGAAASVLGSVLFGTVYLGYFFPRFPLWQVISMAVLGNISGQLGDLAESALKRGAGVKDSSNLLPGHGGVLDRLDSSMFALPVVFLISIVHVK